MNVIVVGIGGAIGALLRFTISEIIPFHGGFPYATLLINLFGSFGLAFLLSHTTMLKNGHVKLALTTGLLGAFTTFSTYSFETFTLLDNGDVFTALMYILASSIGGFIASFGGYYVAKKVVPK